MSISVSYSASRKDKKLKKWISEMKKLRMRKKRFGVNYS